MGRGSNGQTEIGAPRAGLGRLRAFGISTAGIELELERTGVDESCFETDAVEVNGSPRCRSVKLSVGNDSVIFEEYQPLKDVEALLALLPDDAGEAGLQIALRSYSAGFRAGYDKDRYWED